MVVLKHLVPAALLGVVVLPDRPPPDHGFLVAPGRVRQDPTAAAGALEALVVDETVYAFQDWLRRSLRTLPSLRIVAIHAAGTAGFPPLHQMIAGCAPCSQTILSTGRLIAVVFSPAQGL